MPLQLRTLDFGVGRAGGKDPIDRGVEASRRFNQTLNKGQQQTLTFALAQKELQTMKEKLVTTRKKNQTDTLLGLARIVAKNDSIPRDEKNIKLNGIINQVKSLSDLSSKDQTVVDSDDDGMATLVNTRGEAEFVNLGGNEGGTVSAFTDVDKEIARLRRIINDPRSTGTEVESATNFLNKLVDKRGEFISRQNAKESNQAFKSFTKNLAEAQGNPFVAFNNLTPSQQTAISRDETFSKQRDEKLLNFSLTNFNQFMADLGTTQNTQNEILARFTQKFPEQGAFISRKFFGEISTTSQREKESRNELQEKRLKRADELNESARKSLLEQKKLELTQQDSEAKRAKTEAEIKNLEAKTNQLENKDPRKVSQDVLDFFGGDISNVPTDQLKSASEQLRIEKTERAKGFGTGSGLDLTKSVQSDLQKQALASQQFVDTAETLIPLITAGTVGATGSVVKFTEGTQNALIDFASVLSGSNKSKPFLGDEDEKPIREDFFNGLGTKGRIVESLGRIAAFMRARIDNPDGRISDKDLESAKISLGLDSNFVGAKDVVAIIKNLVRIEKRNNKRRIETLKRRSILENSLNSEQTGTNEVQLNDIGQLFDQQ